MSQLLIGHTDFGKLSDKAVNRLFMPSCSCLFSYFIFHIFVYKKGDSDILSTWLYLMQDKVKQ